MNFSCKTNGDNITEWLPSFGGQCLQIKATDLLIHDESSNVSIYLLIELYCIMFKYVRLTEKKYEVYLQRSLYLRLFLIKWYSFSLALESFQLETYPSRFMSMFKHIFILITGSTKRRITIKTPVFKTNYTIHFLSGIA